MRRGTNQYSHKYKGLSKKAWRDIVVLCVIIVITTVLGHQAASQNALPYVSPLPKANAQELFLTQFLIHFDKPLTDNNNHVLTDAQISNWYTFTKKAHELAPLYNYPVNLLLAQAALESARGTSDFAVNRFNYFGIGAFDDNPDNPDNAYSYENQEQGIIEYMLFVRDHFPQAWANRDNPEVMLQYLENNDSGNFYASDPDYVNKVMGMPEWSEQ